MSILGIDIGSALCGASVMLADGRIRGLSWGESQSARPRLRIATGACRSRDVLWLGEAALFTTACEKEQMFRGTALEGVTIPLGDNRMALDEVAYHLVRTVAERAEIVFGAKPKAACMAASTPDKGVSRILCRASRFAGVRLSLAEPWEAAAEQIAWAMQVDPSKPIALMDWGAAGLKLWLINPTDSTTARTLRSSLIVEEIGAANLVLALADEIGVVTTKSLETALVRAARFDLCISLLGGGSGLEGLDDGLRLLGRGSERLPVAGLRTALRRLFEARFGQVRQRIADWALSMEDSLPGSHWQLFGGLSEVSWLSGLLCDRLQPVLGPINTVENGNSVVGNGAARLGSKHERQRSNTPQSLRYSVGIMRQTQAGSAEFQQLIPAGATLPTSWVRRLRSAPSAGLAVDLFLVDPHSQSSIKGGRLVLDEKELASSIHGESRLGIDVDLDQWMRVWIEQGDTVVSEDFFPVDWHNAESSLNLETHRESMREKKVML